MTIAAEIIPVLNISFNGGLAQLVFNVTVWKTGQAEERTRLT